MFLRKKSTGIPIDHARVIDGFGELAGRTIYEDRRVRCGVCGITFIMTAAAQKYVHEVRGVPVKMISRGLSGYCAECLPAREARNRDARRMREYMRALEVMKTTPDDVDAIFASLAAGLRVPALRPVQADKLVALARRAGRLAPTRPEWLYWEGRAQLAAARDARGHRSLERFLLESSSQRRLSELRGDAKTRLSQPIA